MARCNQVLQLLRDTGPLPESFSLKHPLIHHFTFLVASFFAPAFMFAGNIVASGASWSCPDTLIVLATVPCVSIYGNAVTACAELIFICVISALNSDIKKRVEDFEDDKDFSAFCQKQKRHYHIFKESERSFGAVVFAPCSFSIVVLTVNTYFTVVNVATLFWAERTASYLNAAREVLAIFVYVKRLLHLANYAQRLSNAVEDTMCWRN
jgi:hypothetical protein